MTENRTAADHVNDRVNDRLTDRVNDRVNDPLAPPAATSSRAASHRPSDGCRSARRAVAAAVAGIVGLAGAIAAVPTRAIDRATVRKVQPAVVQIGPMYSTIDKATGKKVYGGFGWGSGTILTPTGLVLTNNHVADTSVLEAEAKQAVPTSSTASS